MNAKQLAMVEDCQELAEDLRYNFTSVGEKINLFCKGCVIERFETVEELLGFLKALKSFKKVR